VHRSRAAAENFAFPLRMTIGTDLDTADVVEEMGANTCLARSTTLWWMKTTKWSPPRRICWRRISPSGQIEKLVARVLVLTHEAGVAPLR
jgi:enhancing lycopene biosynthesis protein 2